MAFVCHILLCSTSVCRNNQWYTPAECAILAGHATMLAFLLEQYPDPADNNHDDQDKPLIFLASEYGQLNCVNVLLELKADPTKRMRPTGDNCLDLAIDNGHR